MIARLSDRLKRLPDSLLVLKEVIKHHPDVVMYIVGGFNSTGENAQFNKLMDAHGVAQNIRLTGWLDNPDEIIDMAQVLLSTSITEGFPNGINEAQSRGVPCVIYSMPIMLAEDNESIVQVPQGDYLAAAREIVRLLDDPERWQRLSRIALEKIGRFAEGEYGEQMIDLVRNYSISGEPRPYSPGDYRKIIRAIIDYRDLPIPG